MLQWPSFCISISFSFPYNWVGNNKTLDTQGLLLNSHTAHTASRSFTVDRPDFRQQITPFWLSDVPATVWKGQVSAKSCRAVPFHSLFQVWPCLHRACTAAHQGGRAAGLHPVAPKPASAWTAQAPQELWALMCDREEWVSHPWSSWWKVISKCTGLFAPVWNKQSSIGLSFYFSIIPLSRDFSRLLCSCCPLLAIALQICLSFAVVSLHSPSKGEQTFCTGFFFHHEATLATSEQVWQTNPPPLQLPSQEQGDNMKVIMYAHTFLFPNA